VFADAGGPEPVSNYTVTIDWGDGSPLDASATINALGSLSQVTGNHTYAIPGTFTVVVTIVDEGSSSITVQTTADIGAGNMPPPGGFLRPFVPEHLSSLIALQDPGPRADIARVS